MPCPAAPRAPRGIYLNHGEAAPADTLRQRLFTRTADLPEGMTRLPVKSVHINKSPIVIGNLKAFGNMGKTY